MTASSTPATPVDRFVLSTGVLTAPLQASYYAVANVVFRQLNGRTSPQRPDRRRQTPSHYTGIGRRRRHARSPADRLVIRGGGLLPRRWPHTVVTGCWIPLRGQLDITSRARRPDRRLLRPMRRRGEPARSGDYIMPRLTATMHLRTQSLFLGWSISWKPTGANLAECAEQ